VEHRVATNGLELLYGNGLIGALAHRGLASIDGASKDAMRDLVMRQNDWSPAERQAIFDYCASDTASLGRLLWQMAPDIDWPRAVVARRSG